MGVGVAVGTGVGDGVGVAGTTFAVLVTNRVLDDARARGSLSLT